MSVTVYTYNAFSDKVSGGNPAGVVFNADRLTSQQMQQIAATAGLSEIAFFLTSEFSDFRLRFFTPVAEVDLCGHATIAAFGCLKELKKIGSAVYTLETQAGIFKVDCRNTGMFYLEQKKPQYSAIIPPESIVDALNIDISDLAANLPIQKVSTGLFDLMIPVANLKTVAELRPNMDKISIVCQDLKAVSFHVFSLDTLTGKNAHCRDFAPLYGIPEEAATGTASGALASYLYKHDLTDGRKKLIFEQGYEMNRPSEIIVQLDVFDDKIETLFVGGRVINTGLIEI